MLNFLYIYSQTRKYWVMLIFSTIILEIVFISIQYFFLLKPCILCIYQRCALFGITIASIFSIINPNLFLRFLSLSIWIYSAFKGLIFSKKHIIMILHPSSFSTCDLFVQFPKWLPLHQWCPIIFNSTVRNCFSHKWYFLSLEISQWMLIIFLGYLIMAILTIISQFVYINKKH